MPPEQYQQALGNLSGTFSGIGAEMAITQHRGSGRPCGMHEVQRDVPVRGDVAARRFAGRAGRARGRGRRPGGRRGAGRGLHDGRPDRPIRGEAGTDVTLTIQRDEGEPFDMTITRAEIHAPGGRDAPHRWPHRLHRAQRLLGTGRRPVPRRAPASCSIRAPIRSSSTFATTPAAISTPRSRSPASSSATGLIFSQESARDEVREGTSTGDGVATDPDLPVAVLINGGSASASEIVAAALKESGRADGRGRAVVRQEHRPGLGSRSRTTAACGSRSAAGSRPITTASRRTASARHRRGAAPPRPLRGMIRRSRLRSTTCRRARGRRDRRHRSHRAPRRPRHRDRGRRCRLRPIC